MRVEIYYYDHNQRRLVAWPEASPREVEEAVTGRYHYYASPEGGPWGHRVCGERPYGGFPFVTIYAERDFVAYFFARNFLELRHAQRELGLHGS